MTTIEGPGGTPLVAVVGWKNSGKTTLTTALVAELVRRGHRVATVKHAHHAFQIDEGETDSARHRRAGAGQVAIVSSTRVAMIRELGGAPEPALEEIVSHFVPCDVIVVEGYKRAPLPKIEVRRQQARSQEPLAPADPYVIAIASDHATASHGRPVHALDDIVAIADLVERDVMGRLGRAGGP